MDGSNTTSRAVQGCVTWTPGYPSMIEMEGWKVGDKMPVIIEYMRPDGLQVRQMATMQITDPNGAVFYTEPIEVADEPKT